MRVIDSRQTECWSHWGNAAAYSTVQPSAVPFSLAVAPVRGTVPTVGTYCVECRLVFLHRQPKRLLAQDNARARTKLRLKARVCTLKGNNPKASCNLDMYSYSRDCLSAFLSFSFSSWYVVFLLFAYCKVLGQPQTSAVQLLYVQWVVDEQRCCQGLDNSHSPRCQVPAAVDHTPPPPTFASVRPRYASPLQAHCILPVLLCTIM